MTASIGHLNCLIIKYIVVKIGITGICFAENQSNTKIDHTYLETKMILLEALQGLRLRTKTY